MKQEELSFSVEIFKDLNEIRVKITNSFNMKHWHKPSNTQRIHMEH